MRPLGRGSIVRRGILLFVAVTSIIVSTSLLIQDVFAYTPDPEQDATTAAGFVYDGDIPFSLDIDTTFAPRHISITFGNERYEGMTYGVTISDALYDLGVSFGPDHTVIPSLDTVLTDNTLITIYKVTRERKAEIENIPYSSITVLDDTREIDTTTAVQTGRAGEKQLMYEYTYIDGILEGKKLVREETLSKPQDEIIAIGTKRIFREISIGSDTFSYWKKMTVYATSYDSSCAGCSTRTATGATLMKGVCAVDPTVIPMFTKFYVPGYGFCQALDVGGAVKGNKIDLGFEDLRKYLGQWSARNVEIYLID